MGIRLFTKQFSNAFQMHYIINSPTHGFWYLASAPWQYTMHPAALSGHEQHPSVSHLPYPLDLASCNFLLFPGLKITLKWRRFQDTKLNMTQQLQAIPRRAQHRFITKWKYDCNRWIKPERSYSGDTWVTWKFFKFLTTGALRVHRLREVTYLNLCMGRPPTGVMIPEAV